MRQIFAFACVALCFARCEAQQQDPSLVHDSVTTTAAEGVRDQRTGLADARAMALAMTKGEVPTTALRADLKSALNSKDAHAGQSVLLTVHQQAAFPDGFTIPKNSTIHGVVVEVAQHSKAKPNGGLLLKFDELSVKGSAPVPVAVLIRAVAPSTAEQSASHGWAGGRIGGTGNSPDGGGGIGRGIVGQSATESGLPGVSLMRSAGGSGILLAHGENLYLDSGVQFTLVIAHGGEQPRPSSEPVSR